LVNKINSKKQHSAIFSIRAIPKVSSNDVKTTFKTMHRIPISDAEKARQHLKIKIFCSNSAFLGKASCRGGLHTTSKYKSRFTFVRIKYFSKKIVKIENVNSVLKNVSAEKKRPMDLAWFIYCDNYHPSVASTYPSIQTNY